MAKKLTTEDFIKKAREVHGDKFDYSKVEYKNTDTKVIIICPEHGEFQQTPYLHLNGSKGCPMCAGNKQLTTESFIKECKKIHGDKYDYSKVEYINSKEKVTIICPEHGEWIPQAGSHLAGCGCPQCGIIKSRAEQKGNIQKFIQKAREVHGDKYNYLKIEYIDAHTKVIIICSEHGEFEQTPHNHYHYGCGMCGVTQSRKAQRMTQEDFIKRAKKIHGNKYDYSKTQYELSDVKVIIICPEHGEFQQTPNSHLNGSGCAKCEGKGYDYISFEKLKEIIRPLGIKTQKQYKKWWNANEKYCRENGIPRSPDQSYRKAS